MRSLNRPTLERKPLVWLVVQTKAILRHPELEERYLKAQALWKSVSDPRNARKHRYFAQVKEALDKMTHGDARCVYCEHNTAHQVEHFWPRKRYPERTFCWDNLLPVCGFCNNKKNAKFACDAAGEPLFIDPTVDNLELHLELNAKEGRFIECNESKKGFHTKEILNQYQLVKLRKQAWDSLPALIMSYREARQNGDNVRADDLRHDLRNRPFSELLRHLIHVVSRPNPEEYMKPQYVEAVRSCAHEIQMWIGE